jgi:hypothetical protein
VRRQISMCFLRQLTRLQDNVYYGDDILLMETFICGLCNDRGSSTYYLSSNGRMINV